jgi:hypothetical protein
MEPGSRRWVALRAGSWRAVAGVGVLWTAHDGRQRAWLEPGSEALLERLQRFDLVEAHLQRLAPLFPQPSRAAGALDALASRGLLVDAAEALARAARVDPPPPRRPPLLAIRTFRRPAGLARVLDGLLAHHHAHGGPWRCLVVDDAPDDDPRVGDAVHAARRRGLDVRLLGASRRDAWLASIARRLPQWDAPGPLRGLLDPRIPAATGARAWNAAVLFGAGGTLSVFDDDFHLPWRAREPQPGVDLRGASQSRIDYHRDAGVPEPPAAFDVIARAHALCGRGAIADLPVQPGDVAGLTDVQVADWCARRIGAVVTGTYGAYAWDSAVFLNLTTFPASRAALWAEPFDPRRLEADAISLAVERPSLVLQGGFTPIALDLTGFAPFAATMGKADDVAFLNLLAAVQPHHCAVEMPWLVGHQPPEPRQRRALAELPLVADPNLLFGARALHMAAAIDGGDARQRWAALCAMAAALVAGDDAAIAAITRNWRQGSLAQVVVMARRALEQGGAAAPAAWREHAQRVLQANQQALTAADDGLDVLVRGLRGAMTQLAAGADWAALWSLAETEAEAWLDALEPR